MSVIDKVRIKDAITGEQAVADIGAQAVNVTLQDGTTVEDAITGTTQVQYTTMPEPSVDYSGRIVEYTGTTDTNYTNGYFYKCVLTGGGTYEWQNIPVQEGTGGEQIQYETMPTANIDNLGKIVQYIGTTDVNYTHGYFYECVSDGQSTPTYSWTESTLGNYLKKYTSGNTDWVATTTDLVAANDNKAITAGLMRGVEQRLQENETGVDMIFNKIGFDVPTLSWKTLDTTAQELIGAINEVNDESVKHVDTMPTASADNLGEIYQYIGSTTQDYENGQFYKCESDGGTPATYSWVQLPFSTPIDQTLDSTSPNPVANSILTPEILSRVKQYSTMPTASIDYYGQIVQYIGETTGTTYLAYEKGSFYECVRVAVGIGYMYTWRRIANYYTRQYSTMPTPVVAHLNDIVQYIGETDANYINGHFYKCISDGASSPTYSWESISTEPTTFNSDDFDVVNNEVSLDVSQRIFTGTQAQWDALTAIQKAKYNLVSITDDADYIGNIVDEITDGEMSAVTSNAVYDGLALKQNITDNNLTTTAKTTTGAINELNNALNSNTLDTGISLLGTSQSNMYTALADGYLQVNTAGGGAKAAVVLYDAVNTSQYISLYFDNGTSNMTFIKKGMRMYSTSITTSNAVVNFYPFT